MIITAILPVSRAKYLNRVLASLLNQTHKPHNLLVVFDGPENEFVEVRNAVSELPFEDSLCVLSNNRERADTIPDRRINIANNHNQFGELLSRTDWVFSIEDDGILPPDALERLIKTVEEKDDLGMVTGVELGRWGVPYVGAWVVDDPEDTKLITSLENKTNQPIVEEIDACGLYCALIRADLYKQHHFFAHNGLGPDVNLGIYLRKQGLKNYIDWCVPVTHLTQTDGVEIEINPTSKTCIVTQRHLFNNIWELHHTSLT